MLDDFLTRDEDGKRSSAETLVYLRLPEAVEDYFLEDEYDTVGHRSPRLLINPDPDGV